jgi:hypothetical protein
MNKYKKILALVGLVLLCAVSQAGAKIGDTQDQVIRFAQKQEDIAQIRTRWDGGNPAIDVVYTDSTTLTHVFGANGREIAQYLYAPMRLTDAQVKEIQRIYHTSWRGMGVTGGVYSWESASNLYMAACRRETYDYLLIWDRNNIGEINTIASNPLKTIQPAPVPQNAAPVAPQSRPVSGDSESPISWREVDSIYNLRSNKTDLQKDEEWKRFKGQRVTWSGKVSAVSDGWFSGFTMQVKMNPDTLTSDLLIRLKESEKLKAIQLHEGDRVRFTGILNDWGSLLPITIHEGEIIQ